MVTRPKEIAPFQIVRTPPRVAPAGTVRRRGGRTRARRGRRSTARPCPTSTRCSTPRSAWSRRRSSTTTSKVAPRPAAARRRSTHDVHPLARRRRRARRSSRRTSPGTRPTGCAGSASRARIGHGPRHDRLRRRRRPSHARVGGEPGRAGAARAAVAGRRGGAVQDPDLLVLDLDPGPPATVVECCAVALLLRDELAADGLVAWAKTSGSKGMQLYVPVRETSSGAHQRLRQGAGAAARDRAPRPGRLAHDQDPAPRQGLRRLVAEQRGQDHRGAVLAARPRPTRRSRPRSPGRRSRAAGSRATCGSPRARCSTAWTVTATCSPACSRRTGRASRPRGLSVGRRGGGNRIAQVAPSSPTAWQPTKTAAEPYVAR